MSEEDLHAPQADHAQEVLNVVVKEASMKASSKSSFPRACNASARTCKMRSSLPACTHCWKRRGQVWYGGATGRKNPSALLVFCHRLQSGWSHRHHRRLLSRYSGWPSRCGRAVGRCLCDSGHLRTDTDDHPHGRLQLAIACTGSADGKVAQG
jgi:hypothetical protein